MTTEATIAVYRPRNKEAADELPERLRELFRVMRDQGVATQRDPWLLRAEDGSCLLLHEWVSPQAARRAADNPAVNEALARVEAIAQRTPLGELDEASSEDTTLELLFGR